MRPCGRCERGGGRGRACGGRGMQRRAQHDEWRRRRGAASSAVAGTPPNSIKASFRSFRAPCPPSSPRLHSRTQRRGRPTIKRPGGPTNRRKGKLRAEVWRALCRSGGRRGTATLMSARRPAARAGAGWVAWRKGRPAVRDTANARLGGRWSQSDDAATVLTLGQPGVSGFPLQLQLEGRSAALEPLCDCKDWVRPHLCLAPRLADEAGRRRHPALAGGRRVGARRKAAGGVATFTYSLTSKPVGPISRSLDAPKAAEGRKGDCEEEAGREPPWKDATDEEGCVGAKPRRGPAASCRTRWRGANTTRAAAAAAAAAACGAPGAAASLCRCRHLADSSCSTYGQGSTDELREPPTPSRRAAQRRGRPTIKRPALPGPNALRRRPHLPRPGAFNIKPKKARLAADFKDQQVGVWHPLSPPRLLRKAPGLPALSTPNPPSGPASSSHPIL